MRRPRVLRWCLTGFMLGCIGLAGCTHNYYYGALPPCGPQGTVQYGSVCDVPSGTTGGTSVAQTPVRSSVVGSKPPSVVVSEPNGSRLSSWRRPDPDSGLATTRVEGAIDSSTTTR